MKNKTEFVVDTKTDAKRIIRSELGDMGDVFAYLEENNLPDEAAEWDWNEDNTRCVVTIAAWKDAQDKYCAAKQISCNQWGCE